MHMRTLSLALLCLVALWLGSRVEARSGRTLIVVGFLDEARADENMRRLLQGQLNAFSDALAEAPGSGGGPLPVFDVQPGRRGLHLTASGEWPNNHVAMLWAYEVTAEEERFIPRPSVDIGRSPLLAGQHNRFNRVNSIVSRRRVGDEAANEVAGIEAIIEYAVLVWLMDHNRALVPHAARYLLTDTRERHSTIRRALAQSSSPACMRRIRAGVRAIMGKWREFQRSGGSGSASEGRRPANMSPITC